MTKAHSQWTETEREFVKKNFRWMDKKDMVKVIGRSESAISTQVSVMGLRITDHRAGRGMSKKVWRRRLDRAIRIVMQKRVNRVSSKK